MASADRSAGTHLELIGAPRRFDVRDVACGDMHTLVLAGELDLAAGFELEEMIRSCGDAGGLTLDLSRLTFMGSTGLRLVLLARDLCKLRGMAFALIPGPSQVQRVFEVTALLDSLPFRLS